MDDETAPLFGVFRKECPYPMLNAAFRAEVEVLLPILFFACSEYSMRFLLYRARSIMLPPDCFDELMGGRDMLELALQRFLSDLPEYLRIGFEVTNA